MKYIFEIVGVSPVLQFFQHQEKNLKKTQSLGLEYVVTHKCTLDSFIKSVEPVPLKWGWDQDEVVSSVIEFWMNWGADVRPSSLCSRRRERFGWDLQSAFPL